MEGVVEEEAEYLNEGIVDGTVAVVPPANDVSPDNNGPSKHGPKIWICIICFILIIIIIVGVVIPAMVECDDSDCYYDECEDIAC